MIFLIQESRSVFQDTGKKINKEPEKLKCAKGICRLIFLYVSSLEIDFQINCDEYSFTTQKARLFHASELKYFLLNFLLKLLRQTDFFY